MNMLRRRFLKVMGSSAALGVLAPRSFATDGPPSARHWPAQIVAAPELALPGGKRLPFGWRAAAIGKEPVRFRWADAITGGTPTRLRLAVALDVRDERKIEAFLPESGRVVGTFDIRFASLFQPYEIELPAQDADAMCREGLGLRQVAGQEPLRVFTGGEQLPPALAVHLLVPGRASAFSEFEARLGSLASIQPFSWNEGCVLDGLLDLAELPGRAQFRQAAQQHLALFIQHGRLIYEDPKSVPADGRVYGIEGVLPFAALARLEPQHPLLELPVQFALKRRDASGAGLDGHSTTSEGTYTVGYPLALLAQARRSEELAQLALAQLRVRQARLFDGKAFYRTHESNGARGNRNWARGVAWQLLGLARTLAVLRERSNIADLVRGFVQLADWVQPFQRADGLWSVFVHEPQLTPDTAGSAGLAAALALGARHGWLPATARTAAAKTLEGLKAHLTPDGFLGGVSQSNKGGEALQRGSYRVIYQMAMGLMAQLIAALEAPPSKGTV